jgi:hypothetical protein
VAGADQALAAKVRAAADAILIEARTTAQRLAAQTRARAAQPVPDPGQHSRSAAGLPDVGKQREPAQDS